MDEAARQQQLARQILKKMQELVNCPMRFGRIFSVARKFEGVVRRVSWQGPCARRGGAFVLWCDYDNLKEQHHKKVLLRMLEHYRQHLQQLKQEGAKPLKKRRRNFQECRTLTVNASKDLHVQLNGVWCKFFDYIPTPVRELSAVDVETWLWDEVDRKQEPAAGTAPVSSTAADIAADFRAAVGGTSMPRLEKLLTHTFNTQARTDVQQFLEGIQPRENFVLQTLHLYDQLQSRGCDENQLQCVLSHAHNVAREAGVSWVKLPPLE